MASTASMMTCFGSAVQQGLTDGHVMMDGCRAVAVSGAVAASKAGVARVIRIKALKMSMA